MISGVLQLNLYPYYPPAIKARQLLFQLPFMAPWWTPNGIIMDLCYDHNIG